MAVTRATATYRVRIATRGSTTVSGNVALTLPISDLAGVPTITGPSVDLLAGTSTSHPFSVDCIVDDVLFVSGGRLTLIGRLIEIQRSTDGGSTWVTLATGRVAGASEPDGKGLIQVRVSDERWVERDTEIFGTTDTIQLHPPGLAVDWADFDAAGNETYTVEAVSGSAVLLEADRIGTATKDLTIARSLRVALADDLVAAQDFDHSAANSAGNFEALRFDLVSGAPSPGDRTVISFSRTLSALVNSSIILDELRPAGDGRLTTMWVYFGGGHGLTGGESITGRLYFTDPIRVSGNIALHIGGADGVHPFDLLGDILDGTYGGQAAVYDSSAMTALQALPLQPIWVRANEPVQRAPWTANLYRPYAVGPLIGTDLSYRPTYIGMPQDEDPSNLPVLTASNGVTAEWDYGSRDLVNVIDMVAKSAEALDLASDRGADWPVDEIGIEDIPIRGIEHDNVSDLGRVVQRYDLDIILATGDQAGVSAARDVARSLAATIFAVFGDGPQWGRVTVPDDSTLQVGDLVLLDQDTFRGFNPNTGDRTGDRVVRLIEIVEHAPAHKTFRYLDMGADDQPLAAPTVSVAQNGSDADLIDVTVSNLPSGATAVVQVTESATTPGETDWTFTRSGVGNETTSFRLRAASGTVWARAKSVAPHRIESPWASDSASLSTRAQIRGMGVIRETLTDFRVIWRVDAATTGGIRADYGVHDRDEAPTIDGTNQQDYDEADGGFSVTGALRSTAQAVTVELTPYPTFSGGSVSGTAGESMRRRALIVQARGSRAIYRATLAAVGVDFDANGEVVVSAQADDEAATLYVTVGDGTSPADPTAGANDGSITGRSGSVATGVKITTGNEAFVKVVAADLGGNLGPVTEVRQARRLGPFANTRNQSHTGDTVETSLVTYTIPANTLGSNGSAYLEAIVIPGGTAAVKDVRIYVGGNVVFDYEIGSSETGRFHIFFRLVAYNSTSDQEGVTTIIGESGVIDTTVASVAASTINSIDIEIRVQLTDSGDSIEVEWAQLVLPGTA